MRTRTSILSVLLVGCLAACSARVGPQDGAAAQARRIGELEQEIERLSIEVADARTALKAERASTSPGTSDPASASVPLPTPDRLVLASGSVVRREPAGGELRLRVRTEDARGRFVQATGPAVVEAVAIGDSGDPTKVGRWEIDRDAWRAGLREGFMGTAYALDLPIEGAMPVRATRLLVRTTVDDPRIEEVLGLETELPIVDVEPGTREETR